jgi:PAS domain S-box-containing protein
MKNSPSKHIDLETIFKDFNNVAIIIKDNYNFNYANRICINLLGYKEREIQDMSFIELLTPDSLESCIDNIRSLRETGFCQPFIVNILKKNGGILSLELSGIRLSDGRFFFTGRNLSLERIRKEKLEYLEEFNKNILNSIGEGIVVLDPQGNIIKFNDFMERNFKWRKADILGKNAFELFPNLKDQGLMDNFVNIVDKGISSRRENILGIGIFSGKPAVINLRGYPLKKGKIISGAVIVVEDISKEAEISRQIQKTSTIREKVNRIIESIILYNTLPEILSKLSLGLMNELGYRRGAVFLAGDDGKSLEIVDIFSSINTEREIERAKKKIQKGLEEGKSITLQVFKNGKSRIVKNVKKTKGYFEVFSDTRAEMIVPIKMKNMISGVLTIASTQANRFDETDLKFVEMLANSVAITLEKMRFFEALLKKIQYLSILYEVSQILHREKGERLKFEKVLKHIHENISYSSTIIFNFNSKKKSSIIASCKIPEEIKNEFSSISAISRKTLYGKINNGNPYIVDNMLHSKKTFLKKLYEKGIRSLYMFPLFQEDSIDGCLTLMSEKPFVLKKDQISLLTAIANQLSLSS